MKKSNEKGFLLAEAIIVGVFVLSLFTFLFVNVVPLVGVYEIEEKYDTIDGVYKANLVRTLIMEDSKASSILKLGTNKYKLYTPTTLCVSGVIEKVNYCKTLLNKTFLSVKNIYVTWYRTADIKTAAKNNTRDFDRANRDYIEALDDFTQPSGTTYDKYHRLIIEYNDGSFANIEVRVSE